MYIDHDDYCRPYRLPMVLIATSKGFCYVIKVARVCCNADFKLSVEFVKTLYLNVFIKKQKLYLRRNKQEINELSI